MTDDYSRRFSGFVIGAVICVGLVLSALFEFQVDKPAVARLDDGEVPTYPTVLKNASIEGSVTAMFVVDTAGRAVESTFKVLESDHVLFAAAVKRALPGMRFTPAEKNGRKARMWFQQSFQFRLDR